MFSQEWQGKDLREGRLQEREAKGVSGPSKLRVNEW